jgi:hypothetical protein
MDRHSFARFPFLFPNCIRQRGLDLLNERVISRHRRSPYSAELLLRHHPLERAILSFSELRHVSCRRLPRSAYEIQWLAQFFRLSPYPGL